MQDRPLFKGLPIPYTTFIGADGLPDFKVLDALLRQRCLTRSLCGLCGNPLDKRVMVFIGGPECANNRLFFDPPMHQECAVYATKACPYLSDAEWDYADRPYRHQQKGDIVIRRGEADAHRPEHIGVFYCRSYDMVKFQGAWFAKAGRFFKADWDACARKRVIHTPAHSV